MSFMSLCRQVNQYNFIFCSKKRNTKRATLIQERISQCKKYFSFSLSTLYEKPLKKRLYFGTDEAEHMNPSMSVSDEAMRMNKKFYHLKHLFASIAIISLCFRPFFDLRHRTSPYTCPYVFVLNWWLNKVNKDECPSH